ncbi:Similar to hypothetical protein SMAC_09985 [Sordaria macrospora k-hell]; acc. no. XP_003342776 [Pyronema omphalodes CBS 100304]|uniref:Integrase zinc-binding domain-containing protein n=1 Tax=Pyronema omphalodes (strain CBS 100304) TaxID=1076935 RepID=U4LPX0_PYROM|nr:Similar to hypothetical protein SMAC_09985 [Sordaria macrospora k-hell]; acc. no. XP_003342776 [Pyronema omphalodes CBS 100304]
MIPGALLLTNCYICSGSRSTPACTTYPGRKHTYGAVQHVRGTRLRDTKNRILETENGVLLRKGKLWVPQDMVETIMKSDPDMKMAGHFGQDKTIELIRRNFW